MDKWPDRQRWANATTLPMWFMLVIYGIPTLMFIYLDVKNWLTNVDFHIPIYMYCWGMGCSWLAVYCIAIIHKARREIKEIEKNHECK